MDKTIPAGAAILLDFIGKTEAPNGYATIYGNNQRKLPRPITDMTIDEVIAAGPGWTKAYGSSACGRYQFMRDTLLRLKAELGLSGREILTPDLQDRLALRLLSRRGYDRFVTGNLSDVAFGLALAKEWASLPVLRAVKGAHRNVKRGETFYAGDALNKALVAPERVEAVLAEVLAAGGRAPAVASAPKDAAPKPAPKPTPKPATPAAPARVTTIQPAGQAPGILQAIWNWLRGRPAVPAVPVVAGTKNDPTIFYVQKMLRERAYYTKGFVDGLDGPMTQEAVAQARKDNGMGDGGIDGVFLTKLPSFPQRPVSEQRASMGIVAATEHAPEVMKPPSWLLTAGLSMLGLGGADGASQSGLLEQIQSGATQAGEILGTLQAGVAAIAGAVTWIVQHRTLVLVAIGGFLVVKAAGYLLSGWIKIRQAFF